jgi:hypothetical protein
MFKQEANFSDSSDVVKWGLSINIRMLQI